jgi:uncharacterized membrane protein YbhN (UPF0104 family)
LKSFFKFLVFLGVGLVLLYFVYVNQAAAYELECQCNTGTACNITLIQKVVNDFKGTNFFWLFAILMAFMISNVSRALRWNQLIEPLGYKPKIFNTFFATMIGYMVNLALPRAGEIAKPATVAQYEKIPLEKLVGTIVVDRTFDVMMLLLVTGLTFLTQFTYLYDFLFGEGQPTVECLHPMLEKEASFAIPWLLLFGIAVAIGVLICAFIAIRWQKIKETAAAKKVIALIGSFIAGVKTVSQLKRPGIFIMHTLIIWVMYYLMVYFCFFAYGPTTGLSPLVALLAFTFGTFGMVIPSPGGMGTYQIAITAALTIYGVAEADAFAFSNIMFFTISIFGNLFFGLLAYIVLPIYNRGYEPVLPENHR